MFASDLKIKVVDGIVVEALCTPCSSINKKKLKQKIAERNLNKQNQKSIMNYRQCVTYIHHGTLQRHVGTSDFIHNWCKTEMVGTVTTEQQPKVGEKRKQGKVDEMTIKTSRAYYKVLFKTALYTVEEELVFRKFKSLVDLQRRNGVKAGSTDKLNKTVCVEMIDILAEVIREMMKDYLEKARFVSVSEDGSQAWKTGKEKDLIYGKFLVRGDVGLSPSTFLLACQAMKDFGGVNADAKKEAFIAACAGDMEVFKKKITCLCADGTAVNMGRKCSALIQLSDYCDVSCPYIHCLNHNLELAIKDSYSKIQEFEEIKESLHIFSK